MVHTVLRDQKSYRVYIDKKKENGIYCMYIAPVHHFSIIWAYGLNIVVKMVAIYMMHHLLGK